MTRKTQQRSAIRQVFDEIERPLSAPAVLQAAQDLAPGLGIATVYRNIKSMTAEGLLKIVELPGDPNRFERADRPRNLYFRCRNTQKVFSFNADVPRLQSLLPDDFKIEQAVLFVEGTRS